MATPAAALADDLREYARALPPTGFPKGFYCALDGQLALDAYKLLCCNKAICPPCQAKLVFPTTCPSCDHSPLEADSCAPNKTLRNTIRVWLQKQKKKEEKAATQASATSLETTPAAPEVQPPGDAADKPVDSIEGLSKAEDAGDGHVGTENSKDAAECAGSVVAHPNESSTAPQDDDAQRRVSIASHAVAKNVEPCTADTPTEEQNASAINGGIMGSGNPMMMNGMAGQMGYGGFNNGMGFGMNNLNGMASMMGSNTTNNNWNGINSMDFNNMNGMYGNYGGSMGMGMNDMSAMNYNGGYGRWNGMGGGYGNYNNGFNPMGGYNQSGPYPEMMNQYPKNNFSNQNQNRFPAYQGGTYAQRNMRNGSQGSFGPGAQNANSRPGSRSGPTPNRDGQSPDGNAETASDAKAGDEQVAVSTEPTEEGRVNNHGMPESPSAPAAQDPTTDGDAAKVTSDTADVAGHASNQAGGLNPIQTFDSGDADMANFDQQNMGNGMQYQQNMMGSGFNHPHMDPSFNANMNMGFNNYGPRGAYNNGAYGAAKVLTEASVQPTGVGVIGAPTGPRAMREGRPNTGFSSRIHNARFVPPPKSVTTLSHDTVPISPRRRVRSRSPQRDESMRVNHKSPSRSRSGSRTKADERNEYRERSRSRDREERREERERSAPSKEDDDYDERKQRRQNRDEKYDDEETYARSEKDSDGSSRRKYKSDKDKHRERSRERERERDRKDRKDRDRDYEYERSRDKDKDRKRRKDREAEEDGYDYDDDKYRSSRRSRKDRDRERSSRHDERERDDSEYREAKSEKRPTDGEEDIVGAMMKKRAVSPPLNAPTGPSANGFSIKGRSKKMPPPVQPPTGPRALQPPKGPAAERNRERSEAKEQEHHRKSSASCIPPPSGPATPKEVQDHYAAERERNARERNSREKPNKSLHSRMSSSVLRPSLSSKRSYEEHEQQQHEMEGAPREVKPPPSGPSSHRDKRRKSGAAGDDNIARLFTAGLRKNAKARRGGVRTEGDMERDLERVERERERR
ncbi:hypothetical protein ACEQ8H_006758 [Pleosporales sp. CAS-2024a]